MSHKNKVTSIPVIEEIPLKELVVNHALSGRTEKEINTNAKPLAALMSAHGFWDSSQPGEYFERDGKKHLLAGFTRVAAAAIAGLKVGYFVQVPDDASKLRTACIRTNAGKPISTFEQGRIYAAMIAGDDPEKLAVGEVGMQPMKVQEIAEEVGVTRQWIDMAVAIFNAPPEIGELIQSEQLSPNVYGKIKAIGKTPAKQLEIARACIKAAAAEGKATATMKHFEAIKENYVEAKKLKAATTQPELPATSAASQSTPAATEAESTTNTAEDESESDAEQDNAQGKPTPKAPVQSLADLGGDVEMVNKTKLAKYRKLVVEAINGCDADGRFAFEEADVEFLADAICKCAMPF